MFKLLWKERMPDGSSAMRQRIFPTKEERFRFILSLEKNPFFLKVLACD